MGLKTLEINSDECNNGIKDCEDKLSGVFYWDKRLEIHSEGCNKEITDCGDI